VLRKVGALIAAVRGIWQAKTNTAMSFGEYDLQEYKHFAGFAIRLLKSLFPSILLPLEVGPSVFQFRDLDIEFMKVLRLEL
jgi:hypothetical protein